MTKNITITEELYRDIEALYKKKQMTIPLDDFIANLLRQGLEREEDHVYKPHDEAAIKERLKALGYID